MPIPPSCQPHHLPSFLHLASTHSCFLHVASLSLSEPSWAEPQSRVGPCPSLPYSPSGWAGEKSLSLPEPEALRAQGPRAQPSPLHGMPSTALPAPPSAR